MIALRVSTIPKLMAVLLIVAVGVTHLIGALPTLQSCTLHRRAVRS